MSSGRRHRRVGLPRRPLCGTLAARGVAVRALVRDPARFPRPRASARALRAAGRPRRGGAGRVRTPSCTAPMPRGRPIRRAPAASTRRARAGSSTRRAAPACARVVFVSTVAAVAGRAELLRAQQAPPRGSCFDPARDLIVRPGLILGPGRTRAIPAAARQHAAPPRRAAVRRRPPAAPDRARRRRLRGDRARPRARPDRRAERRRARTADAGRPSCACMAARLACACASCRCRSGRCSRACASIEPLRLPFPLRSESLLGLRGCGWCRWPTTCDGSTCGCDRRPRAWPTCFQRADRRSRRCTL